MINYYLVGSRWYHPILPISYFPWFVMSSGICNEFQSFEVSNFRSFKVSNLQSFGASKFQNFQSFTSSNFNTFKVWNFEKFIIFNSKTSKVRYTQFPKSSRFVILSFAQKICSNGFMIYCIHWSIPAINKGSKVQILVGIWKFPIVSNIILEPIHKPQLTILNKY